MAVNKNELLKALKADKKEAERMQKDWFIKREGWISETYGNGYGNEEDGKSKIVSKDIKKQLEWILPGITDPFLSSSEVIKCSPVTFEDSHAARQNELLLNTQFCRKFPRYNFIMKAVRVLATEGTVVIQTGWDYDEKITEEEIETVEENDFGEEEIKVVKQPVTKVIRNQPTAVVCRNEDIFIDPTCMDNIDKCQFVIHRYESSLSALKADGRFKNLDKLQNEQHTLMEEPDYYREDLTYFEFKDKPRKKLVVHEYWGNYDIDGDGEVEAIVCAWVGNTIIRLESNPYPDKKPPFIIVPFNAIPFQMFGEALAENIGDNQKVKTAITRGIIDNMARSNNGQIGIRKGTLDSQNRDKFLRGESFEYNMQASPRDFYQGSYNEIPSSVFNVLNLMNNEIESQTGVKSFSGGINGNTLGGTATSARGALDATATRRLNLVRNISENMIKPLMRKWIAYNAEFLEEEEIIRITNEEYVPIKRDDLEGRVDVDIDISTAEDNAAKVQELSFLLQTLGPKGDPAITRMIMADIYELSRMPDKAKMIRDYQPQPDPVQQQLQQLQLENAQLENAKLKADIADKYARAKENEIDARLKSAKAGLEEAKTRKIHSDADMTDLNFLRADQGMPHQEAMDMEHAKMGIRQTEADNAGAREAYKEMNNRAAKVQDDAVARQHELDKLMLQGQLTAKAGQANG